MKRLSAVLLVLALVLSLAACSSQDASKKTSKADDNTTQQGEEQDKQPVIQGEAYALNGLTNFSDGVAYVCYEKDNAYYVAAIDTAGNYLFLAGETYNLDRMVSYSGGIRVEENCVYDKTGKLIASPELSGYDRLISGNCNGYVVALKVEESVSGDTYYVGVLNNKGQWQQPLSADHPIVKSYQAQGASLRNIHKLQPPHECEDATILELLMGIGTDGAYYNVLTNEVTNGYVHYEDRHYQGQERGIYRYDTTGERTLIVPEVVGETFFDEVFVGYASWDDHTYAVYDYTGKVVTDLSSYTITKAADYHNGYLLAEVDNGTGSTYLCLFNSAGQLVGEAIKKEYGDYYFTLNDDGFVYRKESAYVFYDYKGNATEFTEVDAMEDFVDGLAACRKVNGTYCYINTKGEVVIDKIVVP